MKSTIAVAALGLSTVSAIAPLKELQYQAEFSKFVKTYNKQYETSEVFAKFETFKANHKLISDHNAKEGQSYTMAMNEFGDMTTEEFGAKMTGYQPRSNAMERNEATFDVKAPKDTSIDWTTKGAVTPVKNQGQCGSCWAFSTTGGIEGAAAVAGNGLTSLSEQQLVDCAGSSGNQGCNGGLMDNAFKWVEQNGGLCKEEDYPYHATDGTCKTSCTKVTQITGFTDVKQGDEDALMSALQIGPVSIAIEADQSGFQFYSGGVFDGACGKQLDHGVLLVGAGTDTGKDYWKVKNSWGATWGDQGYIRMIRGRDQCGLADAASYPKVTPQTPTPPPQPTPPPPPTPVPSNNGVCSEKQNKDDCLKTYMNGKECNWCDYFIFGICQQDAC